MCSGNLIKVTISMKKWSHPYHISRVQVANAVAGLTGVLVGNRLADVLANIRYGTGGHVFAQTKHVAVVGVGEKPRAFPGYSGEIVKIARPRGVRGRNGKFTRRNVRAPQSSVEEHSEQQRIKTRGRHHLQIMHAQAH